jgi:hypothetical protein
MEYKFEFKKYVERRGIRTLTKCSRGYAKQSQKLQQRIDLRYLVLKL